MGYSILNDDLYQETDKSHNSSKKGKKDYSKLAFLFIIIIALFLGFFYLLNDLGNLFVSSNSNLIVEADYLDNKQSYSGDLILKSSTYSITTENSNFESNSDELLVENFDGVILFDNSSFTLSGFGESLTFDKTTLSLKNDTRVIIRALKPVFVELQNGNLGFDLYNGNINFFPQNIQKLNYDFLSVNLNLEDYSGEISFSDKLTLEGEVKFLNFTSSEGGYFSKYSFR